jgi:hypothetical protein
MIISCMKRSKYVNQWLINCLILKQVKKLNL